MGLAVADRQPRHSTNGLAHRGNNGKLADWAGGLGAGSQMGGKWRELPEAAVSKDSKDHALRCRWRGGSRQGEGSASRYASSEADSDPSSKE